MNRRRAVLGVGTGLAALVAVGILVAKPTEADRALEAYAVAGCVSPQSKQGTRTWNNDIAARGGLTVNVNAVGSVSELVFVRYPDNAVRHVTTRWDYVYPHDIRLAADSKTLWILISGASAGIWQAAHLYEYDIPSRIVVRDLDVDPDELPEPCPSLTANAAAVEQR